MRKLLFPIAVLLIGAVTSGCVTQKGIQKQIDTTEGQAYQDWQQQHQANTDSTSSGRVSADEISQKSTNQPLINGKLSLTDAMKLALVYNPSLQQAVEERSYAHGQVVASYGGLVPSANLNGTYTRKNEVNSFNFGGTKFNSGFLDNYSVTLSITQPLIDFRALVGLKASKLYKALTDKQIQNATQGTLFMVEQQYYQVLTNQKQYQVNKHYEELSQASLKDVQNRKKFGTATRFNVLRAEVDLSNSKTAVISSKNALEQSLASFYKTLGVSQNSQVVLDDTLNFKPTNIKESQAIQAAFLNRPDLAGSQLNVELQKEALKADYTQYLPTVSAYFDQTWANPAPLTIPPTQTWGYLWNAGLRLNWNIFNLNREGTIIQQRSTLRQQKLGLLNLQQQIIYDVHSAVLSLQNAQQAVDAQKLTVQQANEGLRLAQAEYQQGTIDQVALLEARQALSQAELSYYSSLYQHKVAYLNLLKSTGQLRLKVDKNKQ